MMRKNNFDLVRLLAAMEVVIGHSVEFLDLTVPSFLVPFYTVMRWFPGVPIFFAMSGYLLAKSLERNPDLRNYSRNRALRIFPALWVNVTATMILLALAGLLFKLSPTKLLMFVLAQFSIGQTWAPGPIGEYGLGSPLTPNSALWTIRMEIGFYIALPILLIGGAVFLRRRQHLDLAIVGSAVISFLMYSAWVTPDLDEDGLSFFVELLVDSPAPFFWLFLAGVLIQRYETVAKAWLVGQAWKWLVIFLLARVTVWIAWEWDYVNEAAERPTGWALGLANLILVMPSFAFAFSQSPILAKLRPRGDISYGVYLWHMVLVGVIVHWSLAAGWTAGFMVIFGSVAAGLVSWVLVEKPALALKRSSTHKPEMAPAMAQPQYRGELSG